MYYKRIVYGVINKIRSFEWLFEIIDNFDFFIASRITAHFTSERFDIKIIKSKQTRNIILPYPKRDQSLTPTRSAVNTHSVQQVAAIFAFLGLPKNFSTTD